MAKVTQVNSTTSTFKITVSSSDLESQLEVGCVFTHIQYSPQTFTRGSNLRPHLQRSLIWTPFSHTHPLRQGIVSSPRCYSTERNHAGHFLDSVLWQTTNVTCMCTLWCSEWPKGCWLGGQGMKGVCLCSSQYPHACYELQLGVGRERGRPLNFNLGSNLL